MRRTTCRKDIGLGASMSLSRKRTRPTASPSRRCFANTARDFWCAAAHSRRWKARRAAATSCLSSRTMRPRSPATARPNMPRRKHSPRAPGPSPSLWSNATTGCSRRTERDPALARNWIAISRQSACTSRSTIAAARMRTGFYVAYAHERLAGERLVEPGEIITIDFSDGPQRGDAGPKDVWVIFNERDAYAARWRHGEDPGDRFRIMENEKGYERASLPRV